MVETMTRGLSNNVYETKLMVGDCVQSHVECMNLHTSDGTTSAINSVAYSHLQWCLFFLKPTNLVLILPVTLTTCCLFMAWGVVLLPQLLMIKYGQSTWQRSGTPQTILEPMACIHHTTANDMGYLPVACTSG